MHRIDRAAAIAVAMLEFRRARSDALPAELLGEPAWDLLLELFIADARGQRLTGRDVSERSAIPATVLSRWLIHLTRIGFIVGDGDGHLDDPLTLSATGLSSIEQTMTHAHLLQAALS
ncbi:MAG: hypothetical protein EOO77_36830 [Oxalobacteraceae bacterium]|nr:MAG: hypothetical protein EOO77_36830 [Oxalobacteraceae bacterium]